jgi:polyisoprenoid-binding protein YceI
LIGCKRLALCLAVCLAAPAGARAQAVNTIDVARSAITFVGTQMGVPAEGSFKRFTAHLDFDPARLPASRARIDIELDSFDSGVSELDTEVKRKTWFDTARFPTATFESSALRAVGANRYEAAGKLTIKGRTREVRAPFTVRPASGATVFEGAFTIKRLDYGVGEGVWSDTDTVADEVQIRFKLTGTNRK